MSIAYRARQLVSHLSVKAAVPPPGWLSPAEAALFAAMAPPDQHEGLAVATTLESWGYGQDRALLTAAVLHDAGKSLAPARARYRVAVTLLETIAPTVLRSVAERSATFGVLFNHAAIGGRLAREAGLPEDVARLIERHHSEDPDARLAALRRADALH